MSSRGRVLAVVALLLLAGCAGMGGSGASAGDGGGGDGAQMAASGGDGGSGNPGAEAADRASNGAAAVSAQAVRTDRAIIRTGRMVVEVENFTRASSAVAAAARERGGYVSDSNSQLHRDGDGSWYTGYVVVRVPSDQFRSVQETVSEQGTVRSEETTTEDVTDQLVDLEARLENLRSRRDRLRTFYEEADDTEELLRIEEQLSSVQSDIERLEAKKRSLEQRVAYSTLRVEIHEPTPGIDEIRTQYHEQSLVSVFLSSVQDVYVFGRATLVTVVAAAPWLAVLAVPVVGGHRLLRGRSLPLVGPSDGGTASDGPPPRDDRTAANDAEDGGSGPGETDANEAADESPDGER
ncbi:DUF4349 domain-containing protein [Haloarcula salina]|uniref:DUF4349 domain-containing protein n=1 Tax=Haloarcula salina TaxID=1429914 RepID=A0AA41KIS3_9EURY|nr:DUF4349 domain-containing protein [Haloarcula salina]MBV0903161.1 DUF4349 domain-containing protein [Haloarcula salina]